MAAVITKFLFSSAHSTMDAFKLIILLFIFILLFDSHLSTIENWLTTSYEECESLLKRLNLTISGPLDGSLYCNATWDSVLCWRATPAGQTAVHRCPALKGLDHTKFVKKHCHHSGRWMGRSDQDFDNPRGYTDYLQCVNFPNFTAIGET